MGCQVAETLLDAVETGSGTEQGEPGCPYVGRRQETIGRLRKEDIQQIAAVQSQDWSAVGLDIADTGQGGVQPLDRGEIRHVEKVVDFAHRAVAFVDAADLGREQKPYGCRRRCYARERRNDRLLVLQPKQPRLSRYQFLPDPPKPARMCEVAGADHLDSFDPRPGSQTSQGSLRTGGAG